MQKDKILFYLWILGGFFGILCTMMGSASGERDIFVTGGRNPGFTRVSEALS